MIELYTWPTPNGRKVSIALEELGLPYEVHAVNIGEGEQNSEAFRTISPNGKIPAIVDHQQGISLMESGAILLYLAEKEDRFLGADRWQTIEWLMLQMGGVGPMLGQAHHFLKFNPGKAPYAEARYKAEAQRLYGVLDARLAERDYLAGSYSIADMATWPWISRYEWQEMDLRAFPNLLRWYLAIADRPAVQRGYDVPVHVNDIPRPA
jgi:GST-like protein